MHRRVGDSRTDGCCRCGIDGWVGGLCGEGGKVETGISDGEIAKLGGRQQLLTKRPQEIRPGVSFMHPGAMLHGHGLEICVAIPHRATSLVLVTYLSVLRTLPKLRVVNVQNRPHLRRTVVDCRGRLRGTAKQADADCRRHVEEDCESRRRRKRGRKQGDKGAP